MENIFKNKVVIITGASSGIGEATAREFAANGSKVVLAARSEEKLSAIVNDIKASNGEACFLKTDVTNEDDCRKLVEKAVSEYGTVNILVNNAGLSMRALFDDVDLKVLKRLMDVRHHPLNTGRVVLHLNQYLIMYLGHNLPTFAVQLLHPIVCHLGYAALDGEINSLSDSAPL